MTRGYVVVLCCVLPRLSRKTSDVFDTLLQKQQSKWGNTTGPLLSGLFYCVASCSMILLNKIVLSTYNFSAGISLMLYQVIWCGGYNHCFNWQVIVTELTGVSLLVVQNLVAVIILLILELFHVISTEKLTWKLIKVWIPVNLIFIGMLITGMYRFVLPLTLLDTLMT
jgi:GDP-mannose transporter